MAAQIEALARSFFDQTAPTSAWAVSHEFRLRSLTHCASARSLAMVSAITGEIVSNASSKANPAAFWATARPKAISWSRVDERERAGEGVDAAAASPEAGQVHCRDLLRAHR